MEHDYGATSASDERLILQLLERAPGFVPTYREHRRYHGELLSHVLMGDFTRWFIERFREAVGAEGPSAQPGLPSDLDAALRLFESRWLAGVQTDRDLIGASFLENLWQAADLYEPIKQTLRLATPHLFEQLARVE